MQYDELVKSLRLCTSDKRGYGCAKECTYGKKHPLNWWCMDYLLKEAADAIEKLSKERKTGVWCADYDGYSDGEPVYDMWWCSACGEYIDEWDDKPTWDFCPNCGAQIIGGDDDV